MADEPQPCCSYHALCSPWRKFLWKLPLSASCSCASSSETGNLPSKHLQPLSTHCTHMNNIPWMNWIGKKGRENKQSLGEALAGKYTVRSGKLCGRLHGVTHFKHKTERERAIFPPCRWEEILGLWKNCLKGQGAQVPRGKPPGRASEALWFLLKHQYSVWTALSNSCHYFAA